MNVKRTESGSGEPWRIQLLGTFRVARRGQAAAFRTKKTASLLAYLAFYAGRRISKEMLVDALWPESDSEKGRHSLRVALSSLRATFEAEDWDPAQYIWSDRDTIELREGGFVTDVREFQDCIAAGHIEEAIRLYEGHFLPGFGDAWILPQALELEESYAQAVVDLLQFREGDVPGSVAIGRKALSLCPTREDLHVALMRVYSRAGQTSQAMKQFEELERMLDETWGEMPGDDALSVLDSLPRRSAAAEPPRAVVNMTRDAMPTRQSFFGRHQEVQELRDLVSNGIRLVTLLGLGGSGKTRLGMRLCQELEEKLAGCAWFVSMVGLEESAQLLEALLATIAVPEMGTDALDAVASKIGDQPALLVLDNAEQIIDSTKQVARALLKRCPRLHLVITSRVPLEIEGERLYPVLPLPLPADYRDLTALRSAPSVELLVDAAQAARPGFAVTPANAQSVLLLSQKLEGIPLAIELAAARLGTLTPAQVIASISRRLDLGTTRSEIREQHRSLRTVVEWSLGLLSPEERRAFSLLGVCRGGFNIELATQLIGPGAHEIVLRLNRCSLVGWNESLDQLRFEMLETVREMAASILAEDEPLERAALDSLFGFALALCTSSERTADPASWSAKIVSDTGNILAAIEAAAAGRVPAEKGWELVLPLQDFIDRHGRPQIWLGPFAALLDATKSQLDPATAAKAHMLLANTHYGLRDIRPTFEQYILAANAADESGDSLLRIEARTDSISAAITLGAFDYAQKALEEAIELLPEVGEDSRSAAMCHLNLAWVIFDQGREEESEAPFVEAVSHAERCGDAAVLAAALTGLGAAIGHTRHEEAQLIFERARSLWIQTALPSRLAHLYYNRALIDYRHEKLDLAMEHLQRSYSMFVENGIALGQSALTIGGNIFAAAGRPQHAALCWGRADLARERQGMLMIPFMRRDFGKELPKVRQTLSEAQLDEARQQSRGVSDQGFFDMLFARESTSV